MSSDNSQRTKFAIGHFLTKRPDDPKSFLELAKRYAPRLREVYFAWPGLLNGRAHLQKLENEEERIIADLKYCREHGMKLDLLANAACYGEKSFTEEQRIQLTGIIERLASEGLYPEIVTTTSPYIAKVFKVYFPDIEVRASVNMEVQSTIALEYLSPLFDSFYISRNIQRDLPMFRMMADWCRKHGKKLCMLVNSGCMRNCPWHIFHDTIQSHDFAGIFPEIYAQRLDLVCHSVFRNKRFVEFLRCSWIRPEDVHVFEPELETVKLSTRKVNYPFEIVEAYLNGSYDGDLLRLIDPYHGFFFRPNRIDNKSFPADWVTSGIAGICATNCTHCGKCEQVLEQVTKYDIKPDTRFDGFSMSHDLLFVAPKKKNNSDLVYNDGQEKQI